MVRKRPIMQNINIFAIFSTWEIKKKQSKPCYIHGLKLKASQLIFYHNFSPGLQILSIFRAVLVSITGGPQMV